MIQLPNNLKDYTRNPNLDEQGLSQIKTWISSLKKNINNENAELIGKRPSWWWTSIYNPGNCPGINNSGKISSLPQPNLHQITRKKY